MTWEKLDHLEGWSSEAQSARAGTWGVRKGSFSVNWEIISGNYKERESPGCIIQLKGDCGSPV